MEIPFISEFLKVFKSGGASSNVVGIICPPLVGIGLTELPNSRGAKASPALPLTTALHMTRLKLHRLYQLK